MEQQTIKGQFFVAVITDAFLAKSEQYHRIIQTVNEANEKATFEGRGKDLKPMYVLVKRGVPWRDFQNFPWRRIDFYSTDEDFDRAFDKIKADVKNWKKIQP